MHNTMTLNDHHIHVPQYSSNVSLSDTTTTFCNARSASVQMCFVNSPGTTGFDVRVGRVTT